GVDVFDDDARVEEVRAVVEHEHRDLAERAVRVDRVVAFPWRGFDDLVIDPLLRQRDAHLAGVWTGGRGNQLQHGRRTARGGRTKSIAAPRVPRRGRRGRACRACYTAIPAAGRSLMRDEHSTLTALSPLDGRY